MEATNVQTAISTAIAVAIPLSVAGLFLTMICRTIAIPMVHFMDAAAEKGNMHAIDMLANFSNLITRYSYRNSCCIIMCSSS